MAAGPGAGVEGIAGGPGAGWTGRVSASGPGDPLGRWHPDATVMRRPPIEKTISSSKALPGPMPMPVLKYRSKACGPEKTPTCATCDRMTGRPRWKMAIGQNWSLGLVTHRWFGPLVITTDSTIVLGGMSISSRKCWSLVPSALAASPYPPTTSAFSSTHLNVRIAAPPAVAVGCGDPPRPGTSLFSGVEPIPGISASIVADAGSGIS